MDRSHRLFDETRRFFVNRWKRRIVYKEGLFTQFVSSSYAHLNHWNTIKD